MERQSPDVSEPRPLKKSSFKDEFEDEFESSFKRLLKHWRQADVNSQSRAHDKPDDDREPVPPKKDDFEPVPPKKDEFEDEFASARRPFASAQVRVSAQPVPPKKPVPPKRQSFELGELGASARLAGLAELGELGASARLAASAHDSHIIEEIKTEKPVAILHPVPPAPPPPNIPI